MPAKISFENAKLEFASWIAMVISMIAPRFLFLIAGRGTGKTSDILASRSMDVILDMPGAYLAFVAATYEDAHRNIVPTLIEGWNRKGWIEGRDYVIDVKPPDHWKRPYKKPLRYKHTISFPNGTIMIVGSLDQTSSLAGNSYQHLFGDEAKYLDFEKLKKLMPAMRGEHLRFFHSVYYCGMSFTTDMPDIMDKEYDWILKREEEFDQERAELALQCALVMNEERIKIKKALDRKQYAKAKRIVKNLQDWTVNWTRARQDLTFFYTVSSYANVQQLTEDYYSRALTSLGIDEYKKSVLSLKGTVNKGEAFYPALGEHHFYDDGIKDGYFEKYGLLDEVKVEWSGLRYLDPQLPLECGMDFGNECCMIVGQRRGNYYFVLKEFFSLSPDDLTDLCEDFLTFFKGYPTKKLIVYYDRSGNQNRATKRDYATWLENSIKTNKAGKRTGWQVDLQSRGQATIGQDTEYVFMKRLYGRYNVKLPEIRIDRFQCRYFKSSIELAKTDQKVDRHGTKYVAKDKSSEKKKLKGLDRVKYTTHMSDAGKYLFVRKDWQKTMAGREFDLPDPTVIRQ